MLTVIAVQRPDGLGNWGWVLATGLLGAGVVPALWQHRRLQTAGRLSAELEKRLASA